MESFPFTIVNGTLLVGGRRQSVPIEFTPLYYGSLVTCSEGCENPIDGVLIEPHAFTSVVSKDIVLNAKSGDVLTVIEPQNLLTIHEISGISSCNLAQTKGDSLSDISYDLANFPSFEYFGNGRQKMVDGGSSDNTGILALLRRDCKSIVACLSCNLTVDMEDSVLCDANAHSLGTLAALFGRGVSTTPEQ